MKVQSSCKMLRFSCYIFILCLCFYRIHGHPSYRSRIENLYYTQESSDFKVEVHKGVVHDDQWVARGYFDNQINRTGFGYLELETNMKFDSKIQALHVGFLEGFLTSDLIFSRWNNTANIWCNNNTTNCLTVVNFVTRNSRWISKRLKQSDSDPYWYQVKLFYEQLSGLMMGYNSQAKFEHLGWNDIMLLNLMTEVDDILKINEVTSSSPFPDNDHCSALVKIMPGNNDIYFGHNTWTDYSDMLRILKKYVLRYTKSKHDKTIIPGFEFSASSYPGAIISIDDLYLLSSGLAVMETTNEVFNNTLYSNIKPQGIVLEGIRSMMANRLAVDGRSWHEIFKLLNSGTYNNQWMVFDYNKFKPGEKLGVGAFWVGEQLPNHFTYDDVTDVLNRKGYWSSYNIPYFEDIYKISGYDDKLHKNGTWFSYTEAPRPKIFARDQGKVKDMGSFMSLMRSNDFKKDPFAICNCTPPYSASGAIAARKDLNPASGTGTTERKPYGAIDAKLTNSMLFKEMKFVAVAGPTTGTNGVLPAFKWSSSPFANTPHMSHPDEFNFEPITVDWILVEDNNIH